MLDDYQRTRPVELYKLSRKEKFRKCPAFYVIWITWLIMLLGAFALGDPITIVAVLLIDTIGAVLIHSAFSYLIDIREYLFQMSSQIEKRAN